ncbi:MAG: hypothetical protein KGI57_01010 [Hyphomicrobiales bacterium]|nr:hypothetical protein [Hyphomicrobiales bacterium]
MKATAPFLALLAFAAVPASAGELADPCASYGPGFVKIEGSNSCIKVAGKIEAGVGSGLPGGFGSGVAASVDARTPTAAGPLRTYIELKAGDIRP